MPSVYRQTVATILANAFGVCADEDGIEADVQMAAFNIGYQLFITEMDKTFSWFRLKNLNFEYSAGGTSLSDLGKDVDGNAISNFFMPYRVIPYDDTGVNTVYYDPIIMAQDRFRAERAHCSYAMERQSDNSMKIHFLGYEDLTVKPKFKVQFLEDFEILVIDKATTTVVDFHPKALPPFVQFLVAMYNAIEEDKRTAVANAPMIFEQYFKNFWEKLAVEAPGEYAFN